MLKEVKEFKDRIGMQLKWYKKYHDGEDPKMYVICTVKHNDKNHLMSFYNRTSFIRPCNKSYKEFIKSNRECNEFHMILDSAFYDVDFTKVDKNQFLLECSMLGIMPEVEFIDNEDGKAIDEIDLTTGKSFLEMRKKALEKRKKRENVSIN